MYAADVETTRDLVERRVREAAREALGVEPSVIEIGAHSRPNMATSRRTSRCSWHAS